MSAAAASSIKWTKNLDGSESATYAATKITIFQKGTFWGYYFNDVYAEDNLGYTDKQFAIDDAIEYLNRDEEPEDSSQ